MGTSGLLTSLANELAAVVPSLDAEAEHDRWQVGIGPREGDPAQSYRYFTHV